MTLEAGFCIFLFIVFVAVAVCALYRRALDVEGAVDGIMDDVRKNQHVPFHYEPNEHFVGVGAQTWSYAMPVVPAEKPKPLPKGWQGWEGGECPVPDDTMVMVMLRNGEISTSTPAGFWSWGHYGEDGDIVAWRVAG